MTTRRWWAMPAVWVAGLTAFGCGGSDDPVDKGPTYKYPTVSDFCEAKARAECTAAVLEGCVTTEDECVIARRGQFCAQTAPAGAKYRPTEAEKCLAAVQAAYADDKYTAAEKAAEQEACALLWGGGGGEGATCRADHQCDLDEDLRCVIGTNQFEGKCYLPEEKEPGQSCEAANAICSEGNFCTDSEPHVCANQREEGMSCSPVLPCKDGLRCVGEEGSAVCEAKYTVATECQEDSDCQSDMCSQVGSVSKCVESVRFSANEPICEDFR